MNQSKTLGYILLGIGAALFLAGAAWALGGSIETQGGRILALFFVLVLTAPLIGLGAYTLSRGKVEAVEEAHIKRQQKLLSMVMTRGRVELNNAAIELGLTRDQTRQLVYDLIGKQLFSGYVDWDSGVLYSAEASQIKSGTCPKCGGQVELAGKGLVKCAYCGSEVFLAS